MTPEERKLANQQRERRIRRWLAGLSWTLPAVSFGGFFAIWHAIAGGASAQVNTTLAKSVAHPSTGSATGTIRTISKHVANDIVLQFGDTGTKVKALQQQLASLGFFSYVATGDYGSITESAVSAFQSSVGLPATGTVDRKTLQALQKAVQEQRMQRLQNQQTAQKQSAQPTQPQSTQTVQQQPAQTTQSGGVSSGSNASGSNASNTYVPPASSVQTPPSAITSAS
ncbi:putative peptidoglycan binding protein [Alicyclobacillus sacchari]|uniref:Putative peptidoglycan binding protein n=1 Tax=Alicyclobacillus sacchari TaxID=392010 RepID=A0A4R8LM72_9BACL|nr:peptidoglycan-binding domain-containing protein [Alicyclobacillus sacchari]TDY45266.1 putative peptidoglycan binding protein [Alicyclobacillus sacchari]